MNMQNVVENFLIDSAIFKTTINTEFNPTYNA